MRGGRRSYACSVIAYDHDVAFAVDRQIEQAEGGCLVMDGFYAGYFRDLDGNKLCAYFIP